MGIIPIQTSNNYPEKSKVERTKSIKKSSTLTSFCTCPQSSFCRPWRVFGSRDQLSTKHYKNFKYLTEYDVLNKSDVKWQVFQRLLQAVPLSHPERHVIHARWSPITLSDHGPALIECHISRTMDRTSRTCGLASLLTEPKLTGFFFSGGSWNLFYVRDACGLRGRSRIENLCCRRQN